MISGGFLWNKSSHIVSATVSWGVCIIILATWKLRTLHKFTLLSKKGYSDLVRFTFTLQFPCFFCTLVYLKLWSPPGVEIFHSVGVGFKTGFWAQKRMEKTKAGLGSVLSLDLVRAVCMFERENPDLIKKTRNTDMWHLPADPSSPRELQNELTENLDLYKPTGEAHLYLNFPKT